MSMSVISGLAITSERVAEHFKSIVSSDFFYTFVGDFLGGGVGRGVFVCAIDPTLVVKIEVPAHSFQNAIEWEAWKDIKHLRLSIRNWFVPCVSISPCGIVLVQKRTSPLTKGELPKKIPTFFSDVKMSNFGGYAGRIVAHDYGLTELVSSGLTAKMKTAKWSMT